jgi:hypothetical protein
MRSVLVVEELCILFIPNFAKKTRTVRKARSFHFNWLWWPNVGSYVVKLNPISWPCPKASKHPTVHEKVWGQFRSPLAKRTNSTIWPSSILWTVEHQKTICMVSHAKYLIFGRGVPYLPNRWASGRRCCTPRIEPCMWIYPDDVGRCLLPLYKLYSKHILKCQKEMSHRHLHNLYAHYVISRKSSFMCPM